MGEQTEFIGKCRTHFRRCRMVVHVLILLLIGVVLWLNQIGLPGFVKRSLIQSMRQNGIELEFTRLRIDFVHGLVAENVHLGGETPDTPTLSVQQVHLQIGYRALLLHRQLQLNGLVLRQGRFTLPVLYSNDPPTVLVLDRIQTELRFQTNGVWSLDNFQANFAGAHFILRGQLANASAITNLQFFKRKHVVSARAQEQWKKIADDLNQVHFDNMSQVGLSVSGDASDIQSLVAVWTVNAPEAETPWGSARNVEIVARSVASDKTGAAASDMPREMNWKVRVAQLQCDLLKADFISCDGFWRAPDLQITNLYARLGGGDLHAAARLNIDTRRLSFTNSSCFDPAAIASLLTPRTDARLNQFVFEQPPAFFASGSLVLPDWTNRAPDWQHNIQPTVRLNGEFNVTNASVSGFPLTRAFARFAYSNEVWKVPEAILARPEGELNIAGTENDATKEYQWHVNGALFPGIIQSFLNEKAARQFTNFAFAQPVYLDTQIGGRLYDYDSVSAAGHVALTNFSIRGESVDSVETDFSYANRVGVFYHPHLQAGLQTMSADGVRLDWPADRIYFTNGLGTADPQKVVNAIGPIPAQVLRPYHFLGLPTARVTGYAPLRDGTNADLDFLIIGTAPLGWYKLKTPAITGEIHWVGETLTLTNVSASVYGGSGTAYAHFDFPLHNGANFSFIIDLTNVNVHDVATDMTSPTNHFEGRLSGHFVDTSGSSLDWRSCNGYGDADLRDGQLWDVPLFGILSPFLNAVSPGLGNLRATDANTQFTMTSGVIAMKKLEITTTKMQLDYDGTVDLKGNLNAHVTAQLFRDVPGIGKVASFLISPVTKILEYKVSGTLQKPVYKPVYVPQFLLDMLHPIKTLKDLLPQDTNNSNAPPSQ
jgi:hypothetical protein